MRTLAKKLTVSNAEQITLQNAKGKEYNFYIAPDPDEPGKWLSFTQNPSFFWQNLPAFNMQCEDKEDAVLAGVTAYRLHFDSGK